MFNRLWIFTKGLFLVAAEIIVGILWALVSVVAVGFGLFIAYAVLIWLIQNG